MNTFKRRINELVTTKEDREKLTNVKICEETQTLKLCTY